MSLFDTLKKAAEKQLRNTVSQAAHSVTGAGNKLGQQVKNQVEQGVKTAVTGGNKSWKVTFEKLPETLDELKALPESSLQEPQFTAALTVAALCAFPKDREACYAMMEYLCGSKGLSPADKGFIRDRFMDGVDYIPRSYFDGATPDNEYTPTQPLTVTVYENPVKLEEGYMGLLLQSGGADSRRQLTLRLKPSTGQWFLWEQYLLSGIRIPKSRDAWA